MIGIWMLKLHKKEGAYNKPPHTASDFYLLLIIIVHGNPATADSQHYRMGTVVCI
jgi:hypothetical protein